ncbi:hypothetical protein DFH27DRAFT_654526 [Peziza echinospora]|nr:hypothetical protein DFH27DRAFT_654526 [Peziza echinospora]
MSRGLGSESCVCRARDRGIEINGRAVAQLCAKQKVVVLGGGGGGNGGGGPVGRAGSVRWRCLQPSGNSERASGGADADAGSAAQPGPAAQIPSAIAQRRADYQPSCPSARGLERVGQASSSEGSRAADRLAQLSSSCLSLLPSAEPCLPLPATWARCGGRGVRGCGLRAGPEPLRWPRQLAPQPIGTCPMPFGGSFGAPKAGIAAPRRTLPSLCPSRPTPCLPATHVPVAVRGHGGGCQFARGPAKGARGQGQIISIDGQPSAVRHRTDCLPAAAAAAAASDDDDIASAGLMYTSSRPRPQAPGVRCVGLGRKKQLACSALRCLACLLLGTGKETGGHGWGSTQKATAAEAAVNFTGIRLTPSELTAEGEGAFYALASPSGTNAVHPKSLRLFMII